MSKDTKDRFPLLRKILGALGLSGEAIDDIVERILDWLSAKNQPASQAHSFPYQVRDDFLSAAELSFCLILRSVVGERAQICPKVALGDLFFASTGDHRQNRIAINRIDRKHVDFLLCDQKNLRPLLGIELDDSSHAREDRRKRDEFVEGIFVAAKLPLLRVPVKVGYVTSELEALLRPYLAVVPASSGRADLPCRPEIKTTLQRSTTDDKSTLSNTGEIPVGDATKQLCPKCGSEMKLRTAKSGANVGGQFWGCGNFPKCRFILAC